MRVLVPLGLLLLPVLAFRLVPTRADGLDEDRRVATVSAGQGTAWVRPVGAHRWTPLKPSDVILAGDLVRTAARGAHALELALPGGGGLVLGPGATVELGEGGVVRAAGGDLEVTGRTEAPVRVEGPGGFAAAVTGTGFYRVSDTGVDTLERAPRWLEGYRGTVGEEWMGSLLANVDGRNVPLAVGEHLVTVEVRDQIARTTVEETFVNATDARLEGTFYFPLPADASVSGFALWVGGELIEADVVERARARQIFEDLMRRKKDPGLLEWSGGNLFQARVWPIEPHSEKRVRIQYTQVLRLEGATMRYRYALRSDLLRSKPLRRLAVRVDVLSARDILGVTCPSHPARIRATPHEARVEYDAEEVVPERDLEVQVRLAPSTGVEAVTYRRGEDGWFLLLVQPPTPEAQGWQRDLVPEGRPLDVVLLCDTSGSMDAAAREVQAGFVEALLGLLGAEDRFRLAAADAEVAWIVPEARASTPAAVRDALDALEARPSLGWTDVEGSLRVAREAAGPDGIVVYVGDGIPTTADADAGAVATRLRALAGAPGATVHAVSTSSTYEAAVLEAMASLGGGSVRRADDDPATAAGALFVEAARPALKDLEVRIEGVRTAAVHPEHLPNLPVGYQQAVLGRFLPAEGPTRGTVVVTGRLGDEAVRYTASFVAPADDEGNSFLPRLWARRQLDHLLLQGPSSANREEILALSAAHGIVTPYTSLLVLEDEEDRARYGVARTVKPRGGESYFAEAGARVDLEMQRLRMAEAHAWRLGLRRRMLREIAGLGRDLLPTSAVALGEVEGPWGLTDKGVDFRGLGGLSGARGYAAAKSAMAQDGGAWNGPSGGVPPGLREPTDAAPMPPGAPPTRAERLAEGAEASAGFDAGESLGVEELTRGDDLDAEQGVGLRRRAAGRFLDGSMGRPVSEGYGDLRMPMPAPSGWAPESLGFPSVPTAPRLVTPPDPAWPEAALVALRAVDRRARLAALPGGVRVRRIDETVHPVRGTSEPGDTTDGLAGAGGWFVRRTGPAEPEGAAWLAGAERVAVDAATGLGRRRPADADDAAAWPFPLPPGALSDLVAALRGATLAATPRGAGRLEIRATWPGRDVLRGVARILVVDTEHGLVASDQVVRDGRTVGTATSWLDPVEVAGLWWPRRAETRDEDGRVVGRTTYLVEAVGDDAFAAALEEAVQPFAGAVFLPERLPPLEAAKDAAAQGRATFADQVVRTLHEADRGRWPAALAAWDQAAGALGRPPEALAWATVRLLAAARVGTRFEEAVDALSARVVAAGGASGAWRAAALVSMTTSLDPAARGALLARVGDTWSAGGDRADLARRAAEAARLASMGRLAEARRVRAEAARAHPTDVGARLALARDLVEVGRRADAVRAIAEAATEAATWDDAERSRLFDAWTSVAYASGDLPGLLAAARAWVEAVPDAVDAHLRVVAALQLLARTEEADAWVLDRLAAPVPEDPAGPDAAALQAAMRAALGDLWVAHGNRVMPAFVDPLVDLAQRLAAAPPAWVDQLAVLLGDWRLQRTGATARIEAFLRAALLADGGVAGMPAARLDALVRRLAWYPAQVDPAVADAVTAALAARVASEPEPMVADALGDLLLLVLDQQGRPEAAIEHLARRHDASRGRRRTLAAGLLFKRLLALPAPDTLEVLEARERRVLALLADLLDPTAPRTTAGDVPEHRRSAATASRILANQLFDLERDVRLGPVEARQGWTREELRGRTREASAEARGALVARLATARDAQGGAWAPWLELEHLGYAVELGAALPSVEAGARALLEAALGTGRTDDELDRVLAERTVLVLDFAATRSDAPEGLADRVIERLAALPAGEGTLLDARYELFRLLVALDRVDRIDETLRAWIAAGGVATPWRVQLAFVEAERGRLAEAAALLETVAAQDELSAPAAQALAGWALALGDEELRRRATDLRYQAMNEWELRGLLGPLWRRGGPPAEVTPELLRVIPVLLRKASDPSQWVDEVQRTYLGTRDHRILAGVAEGVLGHPPGAVYPLLLRLQALTETVQEEATVDEALAAIDALRARTTSDLDRRALDLLEVLFARRALTVEPRDPALAGRAAAALARAMQGTWREGERRLYADFLAALGRPADAALAAEQRRQLDELLATEPEGSPDRLAIAYAVARARRASGRTDEAIAVLDGALEAARPEGGPLPPDADAPRRDLVTWRADSGRHADADAALAREIRLETGAERRAALRQERFALQARALRDHAATGWGTGAALLEATLEQIGADLADPEPGTVTLLVQAAVDLHRAAATGGAVPDAGGRLDAWTREVLPGLLERFPLASPDLVATVAAATADLRGPREAIALVVDRVETEPTWLDRVGRDTWSRLDGSVDDWRPKAGALGALEPRLLGIVLRSLTTWLEGGERDAVGFTWRGRRTFWAEHADEFAAAALSVAELAPDEEAHQRRCAEYLRDGLGRFREAVGVLMAADARQLLGPGTLEVLGTWLVKDHRFAEALGVLDRLADKRPDDLDVVLLRAQALAGLARRPEARSALEAAAARWHERNAWHAGVADRLATQALLQGDADLAAPWWEDAIAQRTAARGGGGGPDGALAGYFGGLARARSALGETGAAVDAASAAVVAWGPTARQRVQALADLEAVLGGAPDLDAWLEGYEARVREEGLDAPVLRKALAAVLAQRGRLDDALAQLLVARDLAPEDAEVHQRLVQVLDAKGDAAAAREALLASLRQAPRNLDAAEDLARRYAAAGDEGMAERARTNLVEPLPHEADGHRRLARLRVQEGRLEEAATQWRQVMRTDPLDPTGILALAETLLRLDRKDEARGLLDRIVGGSWEDRFAPVRQRAVELRAGLGS